MMHASVTDYVQRIQTSIRNLYFRSIYNKSGNDATVTCGIALVTMMAHQAKPATQNQLALDVSTEKHGYGGITGGEWGKALKWLCEKGYVDFEDIRLRGQPEGDSTRYYCITPKGKDFVGTNIDPILQLLPNIRTQILLKWSMDIDDKRTIADLYNDSFKGRRIKTLKCGLKELDGSQSARIE